MRVCLSKSIWWNDQSTEGGNSILMVFSSNYASLVIHVQGRSVGHSHSLSVQLTTRQLLVSKKEKVKLVRRQHATILMLHLFLINRHSNFYKRCFMVPSNKY
jgi:hypothetical protein